MEVPPHPEPLRGSTCRPCFYSPQSIRRSAPCRFPACRVLAEKARDVAVEHDDLIGRVLHVRCEEARDRAPAAGPHPLLGDTVDARRFLEGDLDLRPVLYLHRQPPALQKLEDRLRGEHPVFGGQRVDAAEGEHLRAVLFRAQVAYLPFAFPLDVHVLRFLAQEAVRVDLHLDAAVAQGGFGHDRYDVDAVTHAAYDKRGGPEIGVRSARPYAREQGRTEGGGVRRLHDVGHLFVRVDPSLAADGPAFIVIAHARAVETLRYPAPDGAGRARGGPFRAPLE